MTRHTALELSRPNSTRTFFTFALIQNFAPQRCGLLIICVACYLGCVLSVLLLMCVACYVGCSLCALVLIEGGPYQEAGL